MSDPFSVLFHIGLLTKYRKRVEQIAHRRCLYKAGRVDESFKRSFYFELTILMKSDEAKQKRFRSYKTFVE